MSAGIDDGSDEAFTSRADDVPVRRPWIECRYLLCELEGEPTCVIYPADVDDDLLRTHWISIPAEHAVDPVDHR